MSSRPFDRNARLEAEMRAVLSDLLRSLIKDPRLNEVTISAVRMSADRSHAQVYFSVIGDDERQRQVGDGFRAAAPYMRRELGRRMRLRTVPALKFERDASYEYGDRMERLFDRLEEEGMLGHDHDGGDER